MNRRLGYLSFVCAAVLYGTFGLFVRALQQDFNSIQQVVLRSFGAALIAVPWALAYLPQERFKYLKDWRLLGFALLFPLSVTLWTWATIEGTILSGIFGLYFGSLLGSWFLGRLFFKEVLTLRRGIGVVLNCIGLLVFCHSVNTLNSNAFSVFLGTLAGLGQAFALCYRRWLSDIERPLVLAAQCLGPLVICGVFCLLFNPVSISSLSVNNLSIGLGYGVIVVAVSYLVLVGSQNLEIGKGSIVLSTELVWAMAFAALVLGEIPGQSEIFGSVLLLIAAMLVRQ